MVILDPNQINDTPDLAGKVAHVERPDGSSEQLTIHHSEVHHGTVGVFFERLDQSRVPRLSNVTWDV